MAEQTQTTTQQQNNKKYSYDPSSVYAWAQAGSNQTNLSKYGIDFSQAEQDRIANIFRNEATASYNTAQNQYSQDIANQQATLSDTIRRSQAEAVATGASRGLQAANELSSILGLQQAAAQGATQIQGDYASQLASAQQQAMELQNQKNQVGAEIASADLAAEAQKYTANMDFAANDFNRILSQSNALRESGDAAGANALLSAYLAANGVDAATASSLIQSSKDQATNYQAYSAEAGQGLLEGSGSSSSKEYYGANWKDLRNGKSESFNFYYNGGTYYVKASGSAITSTSSPKLYDALGQLSGNTSASAGSFVVYENKLYVSVGDGKWRTITGQGDGAPQHGGGKNDWKNLSKTLNLK